MTDLEKIAERWHALTGGYVRASSPDGGNDWNLALLSNTLAPVFVRYHGAATLAEAIASANAALDRWAK